MGLFLPQGDFLLKIEPPLGWSFGKSAALTFIYKNAYNKVHYVLISDFFVWTCLSPEPTSVDLHVDGVSDICTMEEDINFVFTGFSVSGTVRFVLHGCVCACRPLAPQ